MSDLVPLLKTTDFLALLVTAVTIAQISLGLKSFSKSQQILLTYLVKLLMYAV